MVTSVQPNYYAAGHQSGDFIVEGEGLNFLPSNAIGIYSTSNDDPLIDKEDAGVYGTFDIVEQTATRLVLRPRAVAANLRASVYLGALLSNDGEIVYWVNMTRPLP